MNETKPTPEPTKPAPRPDLEAALKEAARKRLETPAWVPTIDPFFEGKKSGK